MYSEYVLRSCLHEGMFLQHNGMNEHGKAASSDIAVSNLILRERDVIYLLAPRSIYLCQPSYTSIASSPVWADVISFWGSKLTPQCAQYVGAGVPRLVVPRHQLATYVAGSRVREKKITWLAYTAE